MQIPKAILRFVLQAEMSSHDLNQSALITNSQSVMTIFVLVEITITNLTMHHLSEKSVDLELQAGDVICKSQLFLQGHFHMAKSDKVRQVCCQKLCMQSQV